MYSRHLPVEQNQITVREGKGMKDRVTVLPESLKAHLKEHLKRVKMTHDNDLANGYGRVYLPFALERKYLNANREMKNLQNTTIHSVGSAQDMVFPAIPI